MFISRTDHEEVQPVHLKRTDPYVTLRGNLPKYDEPGQRCYPAGAYKVVEKDDGIKNSAQNINWVTPAGGGGPNYPAI
jgi:electron-transferring-flavoprotein dehydrogenase